MKIEFHCVVFITNYKKQTGRLESITEYAESKGCLMSYERLMRNSKRLTLGSTFLIHNAKTHKYHHEPLSSYQRFARKANVIEFDIIHICII